ncbi:MAG: hypothetical protein H6705_01435 [Myxococcales bacterium]|nr:hypothetical protein [Myxococcales bacterium]
MNPESHALLAALTARQQGAPIRTARTGHGTFLTLDLGDPIATRDRRGIAARGALHLWVYLSTWTLARGPATLLSSDALDDADAVLPSLVGQTLRALTASRDGRRLDIEFSDGWTLRLRADPAYAPSDELLIAFEEGRPALSWSAESGARYEATDP